MSESKLSKDIQTTALRHHCKLFRNNSGAMKDFTGRVIRFGLGNISKVLWDQWKTSDLIGYTIITVTPEMVGKPLAIFTAVEVKDLHAKVDARYKAQVKFIEQVKQDGGIASMINSIDSLQKMIKDFWS